MNYTSSELAVAPALDVEIPSYDGSHPISRGSNVRKYRPEELSKFADRKSLRADFFEKTLLGLWLENRQEPVPYAFRTTNDEVRSFDAGCLGYLFNRHTPEIQFDLDEHGYITTVAPTRILMDRYAVMGEEALRKRLRGGMKGEQKSRVEIGDSDKPLGFDPNAPIDEEKRRESYQTRREGAVEFRKQVLKHWGHMCPLSGCKLKPVLDAAHIFPYGGKKTNDVRNGLPLRADLHRLFDRHLLSFFYDNGDLVFVTDEALANTQEYSLLDGFRISATHLPDPRPHPSVVEKHHQTFLER